MEDLSPAREQRENIRIRPDDSFMFTTGTVTFSREELRRCDELSFRKLVRERLQRLGDALMESWRQENGGG